MSQKFQLQNFNTSDFLQNFWGKRPFLIKGALSSYQSPISPEELAGLTIETEVFGRMFGPNGSVKETPFSESDFTDAPKKDWSFFIHGVDRYDEQVFRFRHFFDFIPHWRFDDVSISFANIGGSVGAHFDLYDVFICQIEGSRKWSLESEKRKGEIEGDNEIMLLTDFCADLEYKLEPGDVLYIPPRIAHHGVSLGESLSFSAGFRAPKIKDLWLEFAMSIAEKIEDSHLYNDEQRSLTRDLGQVSKEDLSQIMDQFKKLQDVEGQSWISEFLTGKISNDEFEVDEDINLEDFKQWQVYRKPESAILFDQENFYFKGEGFKFKNEQKEFFRLICNNLEFSNTDFNFSKEDYQWLNKLIAEGILVVCE
jgi:50S ribosomal protein L16 3-hydroxylase